MKMTISSSAKGEWKFWNTLKIQGLLTRYKAVWSKIKYTEKHLNARIVHSDKKTGSRLTREGKALLEKYRLLKKECMMTDDRIFNNIFK